MRGFLGTCALLMAATLMAQAPAGFEFTPTPQSGTFYGQAALDGAPCPAGSWVGAFDEDGHCAGASELVVYDGAAYINLIVYGDDATTSDTDEGVNGGESFTLRLYHAEDDTVYVYQSPLNIVSFDAWSNTNGAPMPEYSDPETVYDWISVDIGIDLGADQVCETGGSIDLSGLAYPAGGTYSGPGVSGSAFDPAIAGPGTHVIGYTYSLATVYDTVDVIGFAVSLTPSHPLCAGDPTGSVVPETTGGVSPFMFDYGNANPMELTEGIVSVTATDAIGCIANADIELIDPDTLVIEFVEWTEPSCFGLSDGQAVASVTGGTGALQLDWNGADPDGLSSGPVEVTVTDENGCSASIGTSLQQPEALTVFANTESVECAGGTSGSISLAISGGTAPYTEDWNGLDPLTLSAGTYSVDIVDAQGCTQSTDVTVTGPPALTATLDLSPVGCAGDASGTAAITYAGGTGPISVDWNGENPEALSVGDYSVTLTDDNGCALTLPFSIEEPNPLQANVSTTDALCHGGATGTATLAWNGGVGDVQAQLGGLDLNALNAGNYSIDLIDDEGCTLAVNFSIGQPSPLSSQFITTDVTCHGEENGTAQPVISGGTAPYDSQWIGSDPVALGGGTHVLRVIDDAGCESFFLSEIEEPAPLNVVVVANPADCSSGTGSINFAASGGSGTYISNWFGLNLQSAPVGTHSYTIMDTNGCASEGIVTVFGPDGICGCTIPEATNYSEFATLNDGSCQFDTSGNTTCPTDLNGDGLVGLGDLLELLTSFGSICP